MLHNPCTKASKCKKYTHAIINLVFGSMRIFHSEFTKLKIRCLIPKIGNSSLEDIMNSNWKELDSALQSVNQQDKVGISNSVKELVTKLKDEDRSDLGKKVILKVEVDAERDEDCNVSTHEALLNLYCNANELLRKTNELESYKDKVIEAVTNRLNSSMEETVRLYTEIDGLKRVITHLERQVRQKEAVRLAAVRACLEQSSDGRIGSCVSSTVWSLADVVKALQGSDGAILPDIHIGLLTLQMV